MTNTPHTSSKRMTQATHSLPIPAKQVLRVGVVRDGNIIHEQVLNDSASLWVGASEINDVLIDEETGVERHELFTFSDGHYLLQGCAGIHAKVSSGKQEQLIDGKGCVELDESSRGRVVIGDITLLFQFINPPIHPSHAYLPLVPRSIASGGIDWSFTATVALSYMALMGLLLYLDNKDWPMGDPEHLVINTARLVFDEDQPPPPPQLEDRSDPDTTTEATDPRGPVESTPNTPSRIARRHSSNKPVLIDEFRAKARALMLGALSNEQGALADLMRDGAIDSDAETILAQTDGVKVAGGHSQLVFRDGGGGSGQTGKLGDLSSSNVNIRREAIDAPAERKIGRVKLAGGGGDVGGSGEFDSGLVVSAIKRRLRGIQKCYERELGKQPSLSGKISVSFSISESGNVMSAKATQNTTGSAGLALCVTKTMKRVRFRQGPEGGSVSYSYPFVFKPQQ